MNAPFSLEAEPLTVPDGIDGFLAPLSSSADDDGAQGVGVSLRHDPVYQKIREARHQDDASLPMREWERPLIKADWKAAATLCADALRTRSKDLQLAAWLCEAWTYQRGVEGYAEGVRVLHALAARFWDHAYPQLEDGDSDARVAPFVWLNQTLATVLKLQIPLLTLSIEPGSINFDAWSRIAGRASNDESSGELNREFLDGEVSKGSNLAYLARLEEQVGMALDATATLERDLDMRLGNEAPSFSRVLEALMDLKRAARSLRGERTLPVLTEAPAIPAAPTSAAAAHVAMESVVTNMAHAQSNGLVVEQHAQGVSDSVATPGVMTPFRIADRAHAYELLDAVAQYLARSEPHSPTPYLLKRAVTWGSMPLPELMREIVSQEGDLSRYFAMLGLHNE